MFTYIKYTIFVTYDHTIQIYLLSVKVSEFGGGARVVWAMSAGDRDTEAQSKKEEITGSEDGRAATAFKQNWCIAFRALELVSVSASFLYLFQARHMPQNACLMN